MRGLGFFATPMPKSKASPAAAPTPATFEAATQELDALLTRLDAGQLPLDELLTQYQRGNELLAYCRARLDALEQQLTVLENGSERPWTATP
jgi:exodeoxyribonuclease VII small subunit